MQLKREIERHEHAKVKVMWFGMCSLLEDQEVT